MVVAVVPLGGAIESNITVILVGMFGGRCALLTTFRCIFVAPWAALCSAPWGGRGGGGEGLAMATAPSRRGPVAIHRHWEGRRGATRPTRRATAPSLGRSSGPWAPGGRRVVPGGAALGGPP